MTFNPFFINSCLPISKANIDNYDSFLYYTAENTGNTYITYSLLKVLYNGNISDINHIPNIHRYDYSDVEKQLDIINNECSHVFYIMQDCIREKDFPIDYDKVYDFVSKIKKPVVIAGLGANSFCGFDNSLHKKLNSKLIKHLKILADKTEMIGVRGNYSKEVLEKLGIKNVSVIGCPSFYEMGGGRTVYKKDVLQNFIKNQVVVTGSEIIPGLEDNYQICQCASEQRIIKAIAYNDFSEKIGPVTLNKILNKKFMIFSNLNEWKSFISKFSLTIGSRVHGSVISLNAGVPAVCTNNDSRTIEMCEILGIPVLSPKNILSEIEKIYFDYDVSKLNENYLINYNNYVKFLNANNLKLIDNKSNQNIELPSFHLYQDVDYNAMITNFVNSNNKIKELETKCSSLSSELNTFKEKYNAIHTELSDYKLRIEILEAKPSSLEQIFSVKNEKNHKVVRLFGIKMKFRKNKFSL